MLYCKGLKQRREDMQSRFWKEHLGAGGAWGRARRLPCGWRACAHARLAACDRLPMSQRLLGPPSLPGPGAAQTRWA
jgi:hypothetical protein